MSGQRKRKKIKAGDRAFDIINTLLLVLIFVIILYPMYYVLIASFSNPDKVLTGKIFLLPKAFSWKVTNGIFQLRGNEWLPSYDSVCYSRNID